MGFFRVLFRQDNIEIGAFTIATGTFMALFSKNAYWGNRWIQHFLGKKNEDGELIPVETIVKFRFQSVLQQFDFTEWNRNYISTYINKGLDPNAFGSCNLKQGIKVGVPEYFQKPSNESIKQSVSIENETIDWESPAGQQLLESLKLSEHAQKFILACNVALVEGNYATLDSVLPGFMTLGTYSIGARLYNALKLYKKHYLLSLAMCVIHITIFSALYLFLNDALYTVYYQAAEDKVTKFGISYIEGGIEYYEKRIQRNKALRELLKDGHKYYTEDGNAVGIFRVKGVVDTFNLIGMKMRVQDYELQKDQEKLPPVNPNPHPIF